MFQKSCWSHLWVRVFAREVPKVTEYLVLHGVLQGGEPTVGLFVHRVVQLQQLHQLLPLHLQEDSVRSQSGNVVQVFFIINQYTVVKL